MKKNSLVILLLCLLVGSLMGCQATQLENRCFPMMIAVDYDKEKDQILFYENFQNAAANTKDGESMKEIKSPVAVGRDFAQSKTSFEMTLSKEPDYNHLKVIVIGEALMEQAAAYSDMIRYLSQSETLPRNTYVCVTENIMDIVELKSTFPQELGTLIEEYLENHKEKNMFLLTLGDIIDEEANREMTLYAPYLEVENSYILWKENYEL